jgi:quinolinate synthase
MNNEELKQEIARLKREKNAIILAHYYTLPEVQEVADFVGDSLGLARKAAETQADIILFAGVHFMAETAKILNPTRKVLVPDMSAGCSLANSCKAEKLAEFKAKHPDHKVLAYVNCTAAVKAQCDLIVTSGNALKLVNQLPKDEKIIFVPDQHLGGYIAGLLKRDYMLWPGYCPTHAAVTVKSIEAARQLHPGAPVMVHPECARDVREAADQQLSTGGMCRFARESEAQAFIVGTEVGILHRLRKENPGKAFYPVSERIVCPNMKKTTLENLAASLREMKTAVTVPADIATRAKRAIDAMLAIR